MAWLLNGAGLSLMQRCFTSHAGGSALSYLVDTRHHCKNCGVSNSCGVDASLCQLASLVMTPIHGRPLCHHHLQTKACFTFPPGFADGKVWPSGVAVKTCRAGVCIHSQLQLLLTNSKLDERL